ncbi:MAG: hypothetical protein LBD66_00685, partial [Holosporales bacterium]|nr:hypothetical protein [Holosporales bacterium]
ISLDFVPFLLIERKSLILLGIDSYINRLYDKLNGTMVVSLMVKIRGVKCLERKSSVSLLNDCSPRNCFRRGEEEGIRDSYPVTKSSNAKSAAIKSNGSPRIRDIYVAVLGSPQKDNIFFF